jgi:hypothetical protein
MGWLIYALGGWFWFLLIVQIVIIIITIVTATSKGYSGFLAFLLGLFIPLLGSLIIVALLPDKNSMYSSNSDNSSIENKKINSPRKKCKRCNREIDADYSACPHCGNNIFESSENILGNSAPINKNYGESWTCKKCGTNNSINSPSCKDCGTYK